MAGTLKSNLQLGDSATATQNFTLTAAAADGTLKLARGNAGATTQDILTVDAAGVASLLGQRIFSRGNVLGTVSQAAGVPTGAVVERGSNANGDYVRFADGTQICSYTPVVGYTANVTVVVSNPAAFSNMPTVINSLRPGTGSDTVVSWAEDGVSGVFRGNITAAANTVRLIAVGRWF